MKKKSLIALLVVLALALAGVLIYSNFRRDLAQARERVALGSQMAATACGPIEYASAGSGPAVLVVHGAGGGYDQGLDLSRELVARGLRVVAMSRFGYLRTPMPKDASPAAQADAYACLLDALHIRRAAIVGASAGAPSSIQFALRHPDRLSALVLLVPVTYVPRPGGAPSLRMPPGTQLLFRTVLDSNFFFWAAPRVAHDALLRTVFATPPEVVHNASPAERARAERLMQNVLPVNERRLGLLNDAAIVTALPRYDLERITAPTLALSVADDLFGTYDAARYTAEHIPKARFVSYPSGGHLWIGHHEEVSAEIAAFVHGAK